MCLSLVTAPVPLISTGCGMSDCAVATPAATTSSKAATTLFRVTVFMRADMCFMYCNDCFVVSNDGVDKRVPPCCGEDKVTEIFCMDDGLREFFVAGLQKTLFTIAKWLFIVAEWLF